MVASTELYDVLGIPADASPEQIKSAYRSKAREHHPDREGGSTVAFQEIQAAYECLNDPVTRKSYDQSGKGPGQGRGSPEFEADSFNDFFASFSFGFGQPMHSAPRRKPKAESTRVDLNIQLSDLFKGRSFKFDIKKKVLCKSCKGTCLKPGATLKSCVPCQGRGMIQTAVPMGGHAYRTQYDMCPKCQGTGESVREVDACSHCKGQGLSQKTKRVSFDIGPGHAPYSNVMLFNEGDDATDADAPGDLIFRLIPEQQDTFIVQETYGDAMYDLEARCTVTLSEHLFGFHRVLLVNLDGTPIRVKRGPSAATRFKVPNAGFYKSDKRTRGHLTIRLVVEESVEEWVQGLDAGQRKVLEELMPPKRPDLFEGQNGVLEV